MIASWASQGHHDNPFEAKVGLQDGYDVLKQRHGFCFQEQAVRNHL